MKLDDRPPFGSLRDLVLRELQRDKSLLTWNDDTSFTTQILTEVLNSEAYILDPSAVDYLDNLASDLSQEDYYKAIANTRMPFDSVWIEFFSETEEYRDGTHWRDACINGALVTKTPEGINVFASTVLHKVTPWTVLYAGAEVLFQPDGTVSCAKSPISNLYDRMGAAEGFSAEDMLNRDIVASLRVGGVFAILCAILDRPKMIDREPTRPLRKSAKKTLERAGQSIPRYTPSVIRLSKAGFADRQAAPSENTVGQSLARSAHWVRGHMFLARNGKLTWRRSHVRGEGPISGKIHRVIE